MSWKNMCFKALREAKMFETDGHRTRFKELIDCYGDYPFFTKGLCKCIYLSAWDEEHFCIMLETLTDLALGRETNTQEMRIKGDAFVDEQTTAELYVYQLSNAFLDDRPFQLNPDAKLPAEIRYIIQRALMAAAIIDSVEV